MQLGPWKAAYPTSQVIGPEGLREKRAKQGNEDVVIDHIFAKDNKRSIKLPEDFANEFEVEYFDGYVFKGRLCTCSMMLICDVIGMQTKKSPSSTNLLVL